MSLNSKLTNDIQSSWQLLHSRSCCNAVPVHTKRWLPTSTDADSSGAVAAAAGAALQCIKKHCVLLLCLCWHIG
jgi:hypothetical protein